MKAPRQLQTPREADGVDYYNNKKAWMTRVILASWLIEYNADMERQARRFTLLLDNVSSRKKPSTLSRVELEYLPPRATSKLQPLDAASTLHLPLRCRADGHAEI